MGDKEIISIDLSSDSETEGVDVLATLKIAEVNPPQNSQNQTTSKSLRKVRNYWYFVQIYFPLYIGYRCIINEFGWITNTYLGASKLLLPNTYLKFQVQALDEKNDKADPKNNVSI